jgi:hypothetical protein
VEEVLFGVAFGQILAAIVLVLLQLAVSIFFWWIAERAWQTVQSGLQAVIQRIAWTRMRAK